MPSSTGGSYESTGPISNSYRSRNPISNSYRSHNPISTSNMAPPILHSVLRSLYSNGNTQKIQKIKKYLKTSFEDLGLKIYPTQLYNYILLLLKNQYNQDEIKKINFRPNHLDLTPLNDNL